jgi:hypothetical protein
MTTSEIIAALALPVATALINAIVVYIGKQDTKLGQIAATLGTDLVALFRVLFPPKAGK